MSQPLEQIAELYLSALRERGFEVRSLGAFIHQDVSYSGPGQRSEGLQNFVGQLERIHRFIDLLQPQRVFTQAGELCVVYDARSRVDGVSLRFVDWIKVDGELIRSISSVYDARPIERLHAEI